MPRRMAIAMAALMGSAAVPGARGAPRAVTPAAHQQPSLQVYAVEQDSSHIFVVTHRTGLLSFLGHEHAIVPKAWTADLCLADPIPAGAHGTIVVQTASLVIDADSARALAGLGGGPGEDTRRKIQRKMLDPNHLDADSFPEIRVRVVATPPTSDEGSASSAAKGRVRARATVRLHGVTRTFDLPVRVEHEAVEALRLVGDLRIRQTDFGIKPESIAAVVKVSNDVDLHFTLEARPTGQPCAATAP